MSYLGLHAIAMAVVVVLDQDPRNTTFDANVMREHLEQCFSKEEVTAFPPAPRGISVSQTRRRFSNVTSAMVPRFFHNQIYETNRLRPRRHTTH